MVFGLELEATITPLIHQYGFFVLFMFMFFETSMTFPFIPSEIVVPVAAAVLVSSLLSPSFVLFVLVSAAGAIVGSLFAYYVSDAASHWLLARYGPSIHISEEDAARAERWFRHYGESTVFWCRFLPVVRSIISIPAGIAEMHKGKFAVYSGAGSGLFAALVAAFVVTGQKVLPMQLVIQWAVTLLERTVASAIAHPPLTVAVAGIVLFAVLTTWNACTEYFLYR